VEFAFCQNKAGLGAQKKAKYPFKDNVSQNIRFVWRNKYNIIEKFYQVVFKIKENYAFKKLNLC